MQVARRAARAGAEVLRRAFRGRFELHGKARGQTYNLVTSADLAAEEAVTGVIREAFPDHAIFGEETQAASLGAEHLWIVDPLDGTNNFVHGIPHIAVSVAYYVTGRPRCGVVVNPIRDEWFEARFGGGATYNGEPVRVSEARRLDESLVGVGFYYDRGRMMRATLEAIADFFAEHVHGIRRFGTAALDLCLVGMGCFGAFFEYELSPWDFAAGRLFVEEAGGRVTTCTGASVPLRKTSILASNGWLHDAALRITSRHLPRQT
ncbi:MAG: inositol monophosphatase [Planctomycetota bacterium]|nr:MAG: inositol monophosphatase [Planctomycetota bacterium]